MFGDEPKRCRSCLREGDRMRPLFDNIQTHEAVSTLSHMFNECTTTKIFRNDGYPQSICESCVVRLDAAYTFRHMVAQSDRRMRAVNTSIAIEEHLLPMEAGHNEYAAEHISATTRDKSKYETDSCSESILEIQIIESEVNSPRKTETPRRGLPTNRKRFYHCDLCGTTTREQRRTHVCIADPLVCDLCHKHFRNRRSIIMHMRTHTGERPYVCEHCGKAFKTAPAIHRHQQVHSGERNFPCTLCSYRAGTRANLAIHERTHSGARPFACEHCTQTFSTVSNQKKHLRIMHELSDKFMCNCGRRCSSSLMLRQHINQHLGIKPYECPSCEMKYSFYSTLVKHARIHHPGVKLAKESTFERPVFDPNAVELLTKQRQ